jgi:hypothetical protein
MKEVGKDDNHAADQEPDYPRARETPAQFTLGGISSLDHRSCSRVTALGGEKTLSRCCFSSNVDKRCSSAFNAA